MILDLSGLFPDDARPRKAESAGRGTERKYTVKLDTDILDLGRVSYPIADQKPIDLYVSRSGKSGSHIEGEVPLS